MKKAVSHPKTGLVHFFVVIITLLILFSDLSTAGLVNKGQAQKAARGWLKLNREPMEQSISEVAADIEAMVDETGQALCYIVNLEPAGFVIISANDEIEPVIAFSSTGYYDGDESSPLTTMLKKDMKGRLETVRQKKGKKLNVAKKTRKWQTLIDADIPVYSGPFSMDLTSVASVSEVWVDPFIQSEWDQGDVSGSPCYNYYTPSNYPCGCVATAMAQVMRYHSWPTTGIGSGYIGGDGFGGAYSWSLMPFVPLDGITPAQREEIGALCSDAGVSVNMSYGPSSSGGSSASLGDADHEMVDTFKYTNSIYTQNFTSSGDDRLWNILNANLDAQLPVMLGISRVGGGHAVIADGYGYTGDTLYHHINMGWGGSDNAWYQLPLIDAYYTYTVIDDVVYNIYTSGSGEIISGRVTNLAEVPLSGVTVTARVGTTIVKQTTTNSRGVFALKNLLSNTTYKISAEKSGESFLDQNVTTGTSSDWSIPGNRSGILFVSADTGPPTAFDVEADVDSTDSVTIQLQVLDDGDPDPNLMEYIITSLPAHGDLSEPNVGPINTVPYTFSAVDANGVTYLPCPYFGGVDTFTYKANDGGTYPTGGDSNIATVTVNVNNQLYSEFGTESNTYLYGIMMDTDFFYDARSQVIYLPTEIGSAKRLTDLSLRIGQVPGRTLSNWTIRMKHTNKTFFQDAPYELETSDWTTVYQANETMSPTGWINFHLDTPFDYNGTQNLMIDFSFNNSGITSPYGGYFIQDVAQNRVYSVGSSTGAHGDPLDWSDYYGKYRSVHNSLPSIKLIGVPAVDPLVGDFDETCDVRMPDLAIFSQAWQTSSGDADYNAECDMTASKGTIDLQDLIIFAGQWLETY